MSAEHEPLTTERDHGALIVTLQRPKVRNALNKAALEQFERIFAQIQDDRSIRVVLLRGAGSYFCAGGDLKERASLPLDGEGDTLLARSKREGALLRAIDALPQIVAAVVEGGATGGGVGILCACDVVVAAGPCHFSAPEVLNGAIPAQIAPFLINRLGWSHGRRLLVTGIRIDAAEALRAGLIHEWRPDASEADALTKQLLASLSRCDPVAVKGAKFLLSRLRTDTADYYEEAARLYVEAQKARH